LEALMPSELHDVTPRRMWGVAAVA
jgi:hypothetical protein